jgi:cytosine/adenosine deaminase-related metal-dependent hydrolase
MPSHSDATMPSLTLHARWVLPVTTPPIEGGYVTVLDGSYGVARASRREISGDLVDLGDVVLLPGLVNAHTHLALSALRGKVAFQGSFTGWIRELGKASAVLVDDHSFAASVKAGLDQSVAGGVTALADIGYGARSLRAWNESIVHVHGFLEVLGMGPKRWGGHERSLESAMESMRRVEHVHPCGLSPHAPYSTDPMLYRNCERTGSRLCTHLAETRDEHQFLRDGTGPLRDLLEEWGLWDGSFRRPGCSPVKYMRQLDVLRARQESWLAPLLAHVNYADDADLEVLAESNAHVVYCPRTHAFFGHEPHRYREMLARGINVCLGTDSLASNETLSMLDELRFLRAMDTQSSDQALLEMSTMRGMHAVHPMASAEGNAFGHADVVAVPLQNRVARDPVEDLLRGEARVSHVFVKGERVYGDT